jgi:kinesin family protein C1
MMGHLSLNDERAYDSLSERNQAISAEENCPPTPSPLLPSKNQLENVTFRQSQTRGEDSTMQSTPQHEVSRASIMAPPKTPRSTQQVQQLMDKFEDTLLSSTRKCTVSPSKSPSKVRPFLTKDSNLRAFTAWDVDERLVDMESQFKALKEVMNVSLTDKKAMEEVIEMAKTRGRNRQHHLAIL